MQPEKRKKKDTWQGYCHVFNKTNEKTVKENWPKLIARMNFKCKQCNPQ